jgi:hypothetical protein
LIIKSHIRGGYRAAADYLKDIGQNEKTRLVQISDPDAKNLDEAFHNMWTVACNSKVKKPLHHISINPFRDERLTDEQVMKIVERCEEKYGYKHGDHQRVIIEHIKNGRQHFHVIWNRVSLTTGRPIWPGHHWNKSKQAAREMEKELGLKRPVPRRSRRTLGIAKVVERAAMSGHESTHSIINKNSPTKPLRASPISTHGHTKKGIVQRHPSIDLISGNNGWPEAARIDWELWGHNYPAKFFAKWPELTPPGFVPMTLG